MPRRIGPETHRKLNTGRALTEGERAWKMVWLDGMSYRSVAATMGMSLTTCWRRANLWHDWTMPIQWGNPVPRRVPPQRGTARCPRGRPGIPGHDGPREYKPPRHLVPGQRCSKLRRDGNPCQRWCQRGAYVCGSHGGRAPQVQAAARRRVEELERESRELEWRGQEDRGWHHEILKTGAERRSMFVGPGFRRRERTEARQRRLADPVRPEPKRPESRPNQEDAEMPVDPTSTAARIAAGVNTTEPELDHRLLRSGAEHRRSALTAALRDRGLQQHVDASSLARVLNLAPNGDVDEVANAIAEQQPGWFQPAPQSSVSELVRRFQSGTTTVQPGS